jgi:hypothetical protein
VFSLFAAVGLVEEAVEEASKASGLPMEIVGRTNEAPGPNRAPEQVRYGPGWAPILIAWTSLEVIPELEGDPPSAEADPAASPRRRLAAATT